MNGYLRAALTVPYGYLKLGLTKLFHFRNMNFGSLPRISAGTEISVDNGAQLFIGKKFNMRGSARIRVRSKGCLTIGDNVSINVNNMIACHEKIVIGDGVQFSPNVQIYDHDHDFRAEGGISAGKYKTAPVVIGNNCWIGANSVILRGVTIGDNVVIGAGSVVLGNIESDSVYVQKRISIVKRAM
jgi:acetyltransferase-like isoleucine patch superfamily enzyme